MKIGQIDTAATSILKKYHPVVLQNNSVRRVYGDGNCLYRAVSSALFGSESHHLLLRLLTTIEIACHRHVYDITNHQCIQNDNRVVSSTYHDLLMSAVKPSRRNATDIPARPATHYAKAHRSVKVKRYAYLRPTRHRNMLKPTAPSMRNATHIPARSPHIMLKPAAPSRRNATHISARPATHNYV